MPKKTYLVRREWTVIMESWAEVQANSVEEACEAAMDEDFDDQEIAPDSDGPTYISKIECEGKELDVPKEYEQGNNNDNRPID